MINELQQLFIQAFPELDASGQQQATKLYELLAKGQPVPVAQLAEEISLTEDETAQLLHSWTGVSFNDEKLINGFWGVSTDETGHRFHIGEQTLYTWCAWDLLFMPHLFHQTVEAETSCPITRQSIRLTISEKGIEETQPEAPLITFIKPDLEALKANVTHSFCQYIFFTASEEAGKEWKETQKDGFLISLDQGFELGQKIISQVFNAKK